jgi:hypothetical protein
VRLYISYTVVLYIGERGPPDDCYSGLWFIVSEVTINYMSGSRSKTRNRPLSAGPASSKTAPTDKDMINGQSKWMN